MVLARKGTPLIDRLMARCIPEPNSGCWLWEGSTNTRYGLAFLNGTRVTGAHRAMLIAHGHNIKDTDIIRHTCDMPLCVNPEHLRIGTQADNMSDMNRKGRHVAALKISRETRRTIRETMKHIPAADLALKFGVSVKTISNIRRGL